MTEKKKTEKPEQPNPKITEYLKGAAYGSRANADKLVIAILDDVKAIVRKRRGRKRSELKPHEHELETTVVVDEVLLKLFRWKKLPTVPNRRRMFKAIGRMAQRTIASFARKGRKEGQFRVELQDEVLGHGTLDAEVAERVTSRALADLEAASERDAAIVRLHGIEGRTVDETAETLGISPGLVKKRYPLAKAVLIERLEVLLREMLP